MTLFSAADHASFIKTFGQEIPILLHGVAAGAVQAIYDAGGQMQMINEVEAVVTKPSLLLSPESAALISKEHTAVTPDGDRKTFGGPLPADHGLIRIELVKR